MGIEASCNRQINYLRISITDRCNLRCRYCMPPEGVEYKSHDDIMRYEEVERFARVALEAGIDRFRLTGGEPLVRRGVLKLVESLARLPGLNELSMTSNGYYLEDRAYELKQAGLDRINISLDTLKAERFKKITRVDGLDRVRRGIDRARKVGLNPVKINVVIIRDFNDDEILDFVNLSRKEGLQVRFIELMPLNGESKERQKDYLPTAEIITRIKQAGYQLKPLDIIGSGPARNYEIVGGEGRLGFISPLSHNFCSSCNRLRLTADGYLKPCLAEDREFKLYDEAGRLLSQENLAKILAQACRVKPAAHSLTKEQQLARNMSQIGG